MKLSIDKKKEVIQEHLPVPLPCYDFIPISGLCLGAVPPNKFGLN